MSRQTGVKTRNHSKEPTKSKKAQTVKPQSSKQAKFRTRWQKNNQKQWKSTEETWKNYGTRQTERGVHQLKIILYN